MAIMRMNHTIADYSVRIRKSELRIQNASLIFLQGQKVKTILKTP